ncbi:MAG: glycosyltransferase [Acidobacteriota bacterium]|nr:MAG: glycosyltransferase [Acidobacteriota bacterium]
MMGRQGIKITLITFEKPGDLISHGDLKPMKSELARENVDWRPLRYHKNPTIPATFYDLARGIIIGLRSGRHELIHGRTFIGGLIGAILSFLTGKSFIYHGEGFWTDQQVEGGFWRRESYIYRVCKQIENWMFNRANALILLSHQSRTLLPGSHDDFVRPVPTIVVPSCVDLDKLNPKNVSGGNEKRLVYIGSLGGRYPIEPLALMLKSIGIYEEDWHLDIYSQSDHAVIRDVLRSEGISDSCLTITRVPHSVIPERLRNSSAGLFFLEKGIGALTCSPTKVGEYLACGLPVVTSSGAGDTDDIVRRYRVGVVLDEVRPETCRAAARELLELLKDPDLSARCRRAAEENYSLARGVEDQLRLYREVCDS